MFHPGKVLAVFKGGKDEVSIDGSAQASVMMWDENMITLEVHPKLKSKIAEGDIVLVDYRPSDKISVPVPRQTIVRILKGKQGQLLWDQYTEYHEKRKRSANRLPTMPAPGYIG